MATQQETIEKILSIRVDYSDAMKNIGQYINEIDKVKVKEKELQAALADGRISEKEYGQEIAATKQQRRQYSEEMRVLQKEVQNNIRQQRQEAGSLQQLRAELSNATKAYDNLSKAEREGAKGKEMAKHINDITTELKEAEAETQRYYRNVGNYQNSIVAALTGNNQFASSLMNMTGGASTLKGAIGEAGSAIKGFGSALGALAANPVFLAIAGVAGVGMAAKWFIDYNNGLVEATKLTREFLGVQGDDLVQIRSSIQATADTYGKEYKDVLGAVDKLMANYGITAQEAMQVVNDGFQAGADEGGNFLNLIGQYAGSFHDAGISASELAGYITQTRSGIFTEQGMALIQMASKKLREMTTATKQSLAQIGINADEMEAKLADGSLSMADAIKMVSQHLNEVGANSQAAGEILKNVFGKSGAAAGQTMIKSLATLTTNMDELKKVTGEEGQAIEDNRKANEELNNVTAALFDMTQKGWKENIMAAKTMATKWLVSIMKGVVGVVNYFIEWYNNSLMLRAAVMAIVTNFKQVWNAVKLVVNLAIDGVKAVGRSLKGLADIVEGVVTLSWDKIKSGFAQLGNNFRATWSEAASDAKAFAVDTGKNFSDALNKTMSSRLKPITLTANLATAGNIEATASGNLGGGKQSTANAPKTGGGGTKGGTKGGKTSKGTGAADAALKEQQAAVQRAEELLTQLIADNYERQRAQIAFQYDKQIAEVQAKLAKLGSTEVTTRNAYNSQIESLEQLKWQKLSELSNSHMKAEIQQRQKHIELQLAAETAGTRQELELKTQQLEQQRQLDLLALQETQMSAEERGQMELEINAKYAAQQEQLNAQYRQKEQAARMQAIQNRYTELEMQSTTELQKLQYKQSAAYVQLMAAQQQEGETIEAFNARKLQLQQNYESAKQAVDQKEMEMEQAKYQAASDMIGGVQGIMEAFGENNKAMAKASKILALAQIAIDTGKALAAGIAQAQSVPFPANIGAISTTVTTIMANIATAIKTVKSAKFATGGVVVGAGTSTSDSIPARLSNGESVMTAGATQMFAPILSAFNQLGGGIPITINNAPASQGFEYLAAAIAKGFQAAPSPVVAVDEIARVQNRVQVIERLGTI